MKMIFVVFKLQICAQNINENSRKGHKQIAERK